MGRIARTVAGAWIAVWAAAACTESPETPLAGKELLEMRSDMVGYDNDVYVTGPNGVRQAKIHSDTAFYFQDSSAVHMVGVNMEVYTDVGAVRANVTANEGRWDQRTQGMHARGNVVGIFPGENRRIESAELYYDPATQRIWSDSASTYANGGQVTRGTCFKSDLSFKNYSVCNIRGSAAIGGAGTGG